MGWRRLGWLLRFHPNFIVHNIENGFSIDSIFLGQFGLNSCAISQLFSNLIRFFNGQLAVAICGSIMNRRRTISSFFKHVIHIVLKSAKKQMVRINAGWIITFMKNEKIFRYGAIVNFIRNSMGSFFTFISPSEGHLSVLHLTRPAPIPNPARFSFFYLLPESFFDGPHLCDLRFGVSHVQEKYI